jgi:hypothetical protein
MDYQNADPEQLMKRLRSSIDEVMTPCSGMLSFPCNCLGNAIAVMVTTYNICHGCQERDVDCENKRSPAFFPLHRAGAVQKSLKRPDLRACIGRSRNRGRGAFPRAAPTNFRPGFAHASPIETL